MKRFLAVLAVAMMCASLFAAPDNSASFSLDGNIGVNFYLDLDSYSGATKVVITSPDPAKNDTTSTVQTVIAKADWPEGYRFGIAVAPVQLTRGIKVEIFNGDTLLATAFDNTAKSIADQYLTDSDANLQNLAKALLTYCAAAQTEFSYNTSNLANAGVSFSLSDPDWNEIPTLTYGRVNEDPSITLEKIGFNSLASTQVNFKFTMAAGTTLADYTVAKTFGGEGITIAKQEELDGTYMVVSVSNITSLDLNETFTFDIKKGGVTVYTVNGSALSYMKYVSATKPDFAKAAYNYGKYAEAYFGNDTNTAYVYTFSQFEEAMASNVERVVLRSDITWDDTVAAKIQPDFTGRTLDLGGYTLSNVPGSGYFDLRGDSFTVKNGKVVGRGTQYATLNFNYKSTNATNKDDVSAGFDSSKAITVSNIVLEDAGINQGICNVHYTHLVCESSPAKAVCINGGTAVLENCRIKADNGYAFDILGKGTVTLKGTQTGYNTYSSKGAYAISMKSSCNLVIDGDVSVSVDSSESTSYVMYISNTSSDDKTLPGITISLEDNAHLTLHSNRPNCASGALYMSNTYDAGRKITLGENAVFEYADRNSAAQKLFWTTNATQKIEVELQAGSRIIVEGENLTTEKQLKSEIRVPSGVSFVLLTDSSATDELKVLRDLRTHVHNGIDECPTCEAITVSDFAQFVSALDAAKTSTHKKVLLLNNVKWDSTYTGVTGTCDKYVGFDGTTYEKSNTRITDESSALTVDLTGITLDLNGCSLTSIPNNAFNVRGYKFTIENGTISGSSTQPLFINYTNESATSTGAVLYDAVTAARNAKAEDYIVLRNLTCGTIRASYSPMILENVTIVGQASGCGALDFRGMKVIMRGNNSISANVNNPEGFDLMAFSQLLIESGVTSINVVQKEKTNYGVRLQHCSEFTVGADAEIDILASVGTSTTATQTYALYSFSQGRLVINGKASLAIDTPNEPIYFGAGASIVIGAGADVSVTRSDMEAYVGELASQPASYVKNSASKGATSKDYPGYDVEATITDNRTF